MPRHCGAARHYLHLHAVDLARSPDGQWWVLADRTQAPSGAGYTLENRIVLSRSLPEAFRDCQVQRLASFFRAQRDTLTALASAPRDTPRVVLLTPGPLNETYFEHAYLARYLGFTLVEGGDLTVRDRRVFIKTLDGLQPVDVIFRRLDDSFCDPLELRSDSTLGVAGLVEAARAGNVTIANALGSGVIETAGAAAVPARALSQICWTRSCSCRRCRRDGAATPATCGYVLDAPRSARRQADVPARDRPAGLRPPAEPLQRSALAREIRAHPEASSGRTRCRSRPPRCGSVTISSRGRWCCACTSPRPAIRTWSCRVASRGSLRAATPRSCRCSEAAGARTRGSSPTVPSARVAAGAADGPILRERRSGDLPSRVADNLFWLGRHAERVGHTVRLLRSMVVATDRRGHRRGDARARGTDARARRSRSVAGAFRAADVGCASSNGILLDLLFKQGAEAGCARRWRNVRRNATAVRDRLSIDTWRILNQLRQDFRLRHGRVQLDDVLLHLNRMITDLAAFSGMEMENMTRGHGWRFLDIGRRLERAANMSPLLQAR